MPTLNRRHILKFALATSALSLAAKSGAKDNRPSPVIPAHVPTDSPRDIYKSREKTFDTGKVPINYLDYGSTTAEPLVMFHGGAWCWQEYLSLIPSLSPRWHVYALDLRGNGKSGWDPGHYRLEEFTEDAEAFIKHLNEPAVLVGHSIGGVVALMAAAQCPEKIKALVIEDAPLTLENYRRIIDSSRDMFNLWLQLKKSAHSETELSLSLAEKYKAYPGVTSTWILFFAKCLWQLDPAFFDDLLNDFPGFCKGYDFKKILAKLHCPILFIRGEPKRGAVMRDDEISWLRQNMANVKIADIKGVGHLLHLEDQGQTPVQTEITTFLSGV